MGRKILICGGSYFIGRSMVDTFLAAGDTVFIVNRGTKPAHDERIHQLISDRNDKESFMKALADHHFDVIIDVFGLNAQHAAHLIEAMQNHPPKTLIFISSSSVYDIDHLTPPFKETDNCAVNLWGQYGTDKIQAEAVYTKACREMNVALMILRPPYVYGEYNYAMRESFIFYHLEHNLPVIVPARNPRLQFIHTSDLAHIVFTLSASQKSQVLNVGNAHSVTAVEWVECCAKAAELPCHIIMYDQIAHMRSSRDFFSFNDYDNVLDVSRCKEIDDTETDFLNGLRSAYAWYCANREDIPIRDITLKNELEILREIKG